MDNNVLHPLCDAMRARVLDELARIEDERNVKVLYACRNVPVLPRTQEDAQQLDRYLQDTVKRYA